MKKMLIGMLLLSIFCSTAYAQQNASATIWFYRPADSYPADIPTLYAVGGITRQLAKIAPGEFFGYSVPPGVHVFSHTRAPARGESIAIPINTGQQAYVEVHYREMKSVSPDAGITAIQGSRSIPQLSAIDNNVIVVAATPAPIAAPATTAVVKLPPATVERPIERPVRTIASAAPVAVAPPPQPTIKPEPVREAATAPSNGSAQRLRFTESFPKAILNVQVEEKKKEIDSVVRFEEDGLVVQDKRGTVLKTFSYSSITSAEYSYAKSPRWKSAIFISPFFIFASGKKHWFMVQTQTDYALIQLDKTNYKLIVAAFETRTGKKVETVADSK